MLCPDCGDFHTTTSTFPDRCIGCCVLSVAQFVLYGGIMAVGIALLVL